MIDVGYNQMWLDMPKDGPFRRKCSLGKGLRALSGQGLAYSCLADNLAYCLLVKVALSKL